MILKITVIDFICNVVCIPQLKNFSGFHAFVFSIMFKQIDKKPHCFFDIDWLHHSPLI